MEEDEEEKLEWDEKEELEDQEEGWVDNCQCLGAEVGGRSSRRSEPAGQISPSSSSFPTPPTSPEPVKGKGKGRGRILFELTREEGEEEERRRSELQATRLSPQPQPQRFREKEWDPQHLHPLLPTHLNLQPIPPSPPISRLNSLLQRFLLSSTTSSPPSSPSLRSRRPHHHPLPQTLPVKLLLTLYHTLIPLLSLLIPIALSLPLLGYLSFKLGRVLQQWFGLSFYSSANTALFWVLFGITVAGYGIGGYRMILDMGKRLNGVWGWWEVGEIERLRRERRWEVEEEGGGSSWGRG